MIYFTSDLHAFHRNICAGTSTWDNKDTNCRDFNTIEEMNVAIIKSINSVVGVDDILYHCGDWSFGGWENIWNFRKQIKCKNIININGNHDIHIFNNKFFPMLEKQGDVIYEIEKHNDYRVLSMVKHPNDVTAKDFFTEVYDGTTNKGVLIEIEGQKIVLNHYPLKTWDGINEGVWLVHGHEHGHNKNTECGKMIDIGWCRFKKPLSFDEIKEIMDTRKITNGVERTH
jgi:calcineurin-like phosphoesterase family protein